MTERQKLEQDLLELGVCSGDVVLVHSSMKALQTELAPEEVIGALEHVLGGEGTLLFPALTYENVTAENPVFDSGTTEPCIGLLPRVFFHMPGVERSVHPTHSVCAKGKLAHTLTVGHAMDSAAVGPHSPFMQLPLYGGKLLFIGDVEYLVNGQRKRYEGSDDFGWGSEFQRIEEILEEPDFHKGKLLAANAYLVDTRALLAAALLKMLAEPYAFIMDISKWI